MDETTVIESQNTVSNGWQKTIANPSFSWTNPDPILVDTYEAYWGLDANGTNGAYLTSPNFVPTPVTTGTYYLRLRSHNIFSGMYSDWKTCYIFKFDNTPPAFVNSVTESHGQFSGDTTGYLVAPSFTWNQPVDIGSGIAGYNVYWNLNPNQPDGNSIPMQTMRSYNATNAQMPTYNMVYFLLIRVIDNAGNYSYFPSEIRPYEWKSIFHANYKITQ